MTEPWPSNLPQKPLPFDYEEVEPENAINQNMETGPPKSRQRTSAMGTTRKVAFVFTKTQLAAFKTFYRTTLGYGSLPYTWDDPETGDNSTFHFNSTPQYKFIGGEYENTELWRCDFEIYEKP